METTIPLFHCNVPTTIQFLEKKKLIISDHPDDNSWGGRGMYFWDNEGNAKYWKTQKEKHNLSTEILKIYVSFNYEDDLLDLTDLEQERMLEKIIKFVSSSPKTKYLSNADIGSKIDFFCEKFGVKLVKFFGKYPFTPNTSVINSDDEKSKLTNKIKLIFCIKEGNDDLIKYTKKIEWGRKNGT